MATCKYYWVMSLCSLISQKVQDLTPNFCHLGGTQLFFPILILLWAMLNFSWVIFRAAFPVPAIHTHTPPILASTSLSVLFHIICSSQFPVPSSSKFPVPTTLIQRTALKIRNVGGKFWYPFNLLILFCGVTGGYTSRINCKIKTLPKILHPFYFTCCAGFG